MLFRHAYRVKTRLVLLALFDVIDDESRIYNRMLLLSYSPVNVHTAPKEQQRRVYTQLIKAVKGVKSRRYSEKNTYRKSV